MSWNKFFVLELNFTGEATGTVVRPGLLTCEKVSMVGFVPPILNVTPIHGYFFTGEETGSTHRTGGLTCGIVYSNFQRLRTTNSINKSKNPLCTMSSRKRRIFDFGSQSDDSQSYGYRGGGGDCPQINTALHRDTRMCVVDHEDEETWEPFPPNITAVVQKYRDPQGGPVTSTPVREGRSPTSPRSPVLGYGSPDFQSFQHERHFDEFRCIFLRGK
jgi:hypothetical protein